jgi:hypothetical protein
MRMKKFFIYTIVNLLILNTYASEAPTRRRNDNNISCTGKLSNQYIASSSYELGLQYFADRNMR